MPQIPSYIRTTSMVFCITIMILGVIGNIMVPIVILKTKDMRNSTNIFLTNLSIADLLVLLVCTPTVLVEVNTRPETWVLGQEMCKAVPFVELTVAHASVLTILAISFERYYAICEPLKAGYVCTKTRALLICLVAWTVAALFTSPILSIASYEFDTYIDGSEVAVCLTSVDNFWPAFYFVGIISIFFLLPFVILLVLYSIIAKHLMNNPGLISHGNRTNVLKYRKQVIFMLGAVVLSFFVCLLPFRALTLWIIIVPSETIMALGIDAYYNLLYFCRIMLYLNSAMNPILYNLMSSKFRDGFLKLLGCSSMVKKKLTVGERKGTFHTTSTNLSSSSQSGRREFLRNSLKKQQEDGISCGGTPIMNNGHQHIIRNDSITSEDERWNANSSIIKKIQKNFDDIQEIEEPEDSELPKVTNHLLDRKVVCYDVNRIARACITPYYIHRTISEHYGRIQVTHTVVPNRNNGSISYIPDEHTSLTNVNDCNQFDISCVENDTETHHDNNEEENNIIEQLPRNFHSKESDV